MSKIEWTQKTWNPLVGCTKVSAGCKNCYAMRMAWRLVHNPVTKDKYAGTAEKTANGQINWTGKVNMLQDELMKPLQYKKPTMFFVNSMSDLFHESVPFEFINAVFSVMSDVNIHTYQVLTKRPARMLEFFEWKKQQFGIEWQPSNNVWIGVSVENQQAADERIPLLLKINNAIRFLSCEPLLGPISFKQWIKVETTEKATTVFTPFHWVIVGGESGTGARPMHPDWVRQIRNEMNIAGVAFFFKQWGEYLPVCKYDEIGDYTSRNTLLFKAEENWYYFEKTGKKKAGRLLDGKLHDAMPL
jgi:protein gp37